MAYVFASFFVSCIVLLFVRASEAQTLEAVRCVAEFPSQGRHHGVAVYTGDGHSIYILGGDDGRNQDTIYLYNITTDRLSLVGTVPGSPREGAVIMDNAGNIVHFGRTGFEGHIGGIYRFNTSSRTSELMGRLPTGTDPIGVLKHKPEEDKVLIVGTYVGNVIFEVDLSTYEINEVSRVSTLSSTLGWAGGDRVILFSWPYSHKSYSISTHLTTDFTRSQQRFSVFPGAISSPTSAFVVGAEGAFTGRGNGIVEVNYETLEFGFWPVRNYPAEPNRSFYSPAIAYVPELHRLYMFGGFNSATGGRRRDIWYIDLPDGSTTPPPTPTFDCSDKVDGLHPSPYACPRYFRCRQGEALQFECPGGHFFPRLAYCDLPQYSSCDLGCGGKEDGLHPHPYYCNYYIACQDRGGGAEECPRPRLFDIGEKECKLPEVATCGNGTTLQVILLS